MVSEEMSMAEQKQICVLNMQPRCDQSSSAFTGGREMLWLDK